MGLFEWVVIFQIGLVGLTLIRIEAKLDRILKVHERQK
jgi:hypothetical protein